MIHLLPFLFILFSSQSFAEVPAYYQQVSVRQQIPASILYAIALQESRPPKGFIEGIDKPWPWTLNCEGKGYFLPSRSEALTVATRYIDAGLSCDIGLMQMSWHWHKARFNSVNDALEPYKNIQAGADYLLEHYQRSGSWEYAVGAYHSPSNPVRASQYRERVRGHLTQIARHTF
jgi:hypothetical protein